MEIRWVVFGVILLTIQPLNEHERKPNPPWWRWLDCDVMALLKCQIAQKNHEQSDEVFNEIQRFPDNRTELQPFVSSLVFLALSYFMVEMSMHSYTLVWLNAAITQTQDAVTLNIL